MAVHRLRPFPALDGLRALALVAVVLFHYPTHAVFVGGLFGVGVFFVLSGFLIGGGLLDQADRTGRVAVRSFLARRAWRLLPALFVLLAAFLVLAAAFGGRAWFGPLPGGPGQAFPIRAALVGVGQVLSYGFNAVLAQGLPRPDVLGHLWTLSVEGQFYLGVAVAVAAAVRWGRRQWLVLGAAVVIAASFASQFVLWNHGAGSNVVYFGTLPRLQQLVGGAALAAAWREGRFDRVPAAVVRAGALAGAGVLVWMVFFVGNQPFKYLGAFALSAAAAAAMIVHVVTQPARTVLTRVLSHPLLTWLGRRSYGIYLWHWPLAVWTAHLPHAWGVPLGVGVSVALAEASWWLVERPAQQWHRRRSKARAEAGAGAEAVPAGRREVAEAAEARRKAA